MGYDCYLPFFHSFHQHGPSPTELLFPRYLFVRLPLQDDVAIWSKLRSTPHLSRMLCIGNRPLWVDEGLIQQLRSHPITSTAPSQGWPVIGRICDDNLQPYDLRPLFEARDGGQRVMFLIECLVSHRSSSTNPADLNSALAGTVSHIRLFGGQEPSFPMASQYDGRP